MKTIVVYGDSNSWGCIPGSVDMKTVTFKRYDLQQRWATHMKKLLGDAYQVIEEALNGRTTAFDDPLLPDRNGLTYLTPCLMSHHPIDLLIMMLGTNDTKAHLGLQAPQIAAGLRRLIICSKQLNVWQKQPEILVISPPNLIEGVGDLSDRFYGAAKKSTELSVNYKMVCKWEDCHFIDAAASVSPSNEDGVHIDEIGHEKLATAVAAKVQSIFEGVPAPS